MGPNYETNIYIIYLILSLLIIKTFKCLNKDMFTGLIIGK